MSIIHVSDKPTVQITAFHEQMCALADAGEKAHQNMMKRCEALFRSKYANPTPTFPTYAQWDNDINAFKAIYEQKKRDPQWLLKIYRATCEAVFGALPVSSDVDAVRIRDSRMTDSQKLEHDKARAAALADGKTEQHATAIAVRAAKKAKTQKVQTSPGAPVQQVKDQPANEGEMMEQFIARFGAQGVFIALDAVTRILAAEKSTEDKAKALTSIRNNLARQLKPAQSNQA